MAIQLSEVKNQLKLYDRDYCLWLEKTSQLLRERRFDEIDIDNLVEEIEGLTKSDRRAIRNRLTVLLEHLLKLACWEQERELNAISNPCSPPQPPNSGGSRSSKSPRIGG
jgi:hypothetical protein